MATEPLYFFVPNLNHTVVSLRFDSHTLLTEQEEWAYSFASLVADLGGLLGLFVGFNFMLLWDFIVWAFVRFNQTPPSKIRNNVNES